MHDLHEGQNSRDTALTAYADVNNISCCTVKLLRATEVADEVHMLKSSMLPWRDTSTVHVHGTTPRIQCTALTLN